MVYFRTMKGQFLSVLCCLLGLPWMVFSQSASDSPVVWSARPPEKPLRAGTRFEVKLKAAIEPNWHMYSTRQQPPPIATRFTLMAGTPFELSGPVRFSEPQSAFDPNFEIQTEFYADAAEFWVPIRAASSAMPGEYELRIQAYYQLCDDKTCLPPRGVPIAFKVQVIPGTTRKPDELLRFLIARLTAASPAEAIAEGKRPR